MAAILRLAVQNDPWKDKLTILNKKNKVGGISLVNFRT